MNDEQYLEHCRALIADYAQYLVKNTDELPEDEPLRELARGFERLPASGDDLYTEGPALIKRLFTTYPELAPALPRQVLWFFGGDCLHYMPDEEIERFAQLEEMRLAAADQGETFNLQEARAKLLNLQ